MKLKRIIAALLSLMFFVVPFAGCVPESNSLLLLTASGTTLVVNGGSTVQLNAVLQSTSEEVMGRDIVYEVVEGNGTVTGNEVRSTSASVVGDKIVVRATAGDLVSNEIELTVVAEQSSILLELEITGASTTIVPSGQVVLHAKKIPSSAVAVVEWVITKGEEFVQSHSNGTVTAKADAEIGGVISVKAVSGSIESDEFTVTVIDPTLRVEFFASDHESVDAGASNLKTMNVTIIDLSTNGIDRDSDLIADVPSNYSHLLQASVSGRAVTLTALGHGEAVLVLRVDGAAEYKEVDITCIKAPDALDIPEYIKMANGEYSIGVNNIDITDTDYSINEAHALRAKNGDWLETFVNLYTYEISEGARLPMPITVSGTNVCTEYEFIIPEGRGVSEEDGVLSFSGEGNVTVTVRSKSGSVREATTAFTVKMIPNGISVNTFEELRAVGMYGENLDDNGFVRPITLNPTTKIGNLGYSLVPEYLVNSSTVYNRGSGTFSEAHFKGMVNSSLKFYGSTTIIGNNVTIDVSRFPHLNGNEVFTSSSGAQYNLFGETSWELARFADRGFMTFLPASNFWADDLTTNKVYKVNKDSVGVAGISRASATEHNAMENYAVRVSDFTINGNWGVTPPSGAAKRAVYLRAIELSYATRRVVAFSNDDTKKYIYPQCQANIDGIAIRNFSTGARLNRLAGGSVIENMEFDNLYGGGLQVAASIATLKDLSFGAIGGAGLELVPEDAAIAGDQSAYIASQGESREGLTNQTITIAGDFKLLTGNDNNLNTGAMVEFFSQAGLTPSQAIQMSLLAYTGNSNPTAPNDTQFAFASLIATQIGRVRGLSPFGMDINLIALYLKNLDPVAKGEGMPIDNTTVINYQLDNMGGSSNNIVPLQTVADGVQAAIAAVGGNIAAALPSVAAAMETDSKYISVNLSIWFNSMYIPAGELIMFNPFYQRTTDEVVSVLQALL